MIDTYCVSGALCSEAWGFLEPFPKEDSKRVLERRPKVLHHSPRVGNSRKPIASRSFPPKNNPSEAKAKIMRHYPKPRLEPPSGKVPRIPKLHRKGHPERSTYQLRTTSRVPFAVKFLESLEPSPKEGSKRGLGQRPKVFAPRQAQDMVVGFSSVIRMGERKVMAFLSPSSMVMTLSSCSMERTRS